MDNLSTLTEEAMQAIIHNLKMNGLSFIERDAIGEITQMINRLPSPQDITTIYQSPREVERLCAEVGVIMSVIDYYGTKGEEYRSRFKAKTKLPPRYKTLKWTKASKIIKVDKNGA